MLIFTADAHETETWLIELFTGICISSIKFVFILIFLYEVTKKSIWTMINGAEQVIDFFKTMILLRINPSYSSFCTIWSHILVM